MPPTGEKCIVLENWEIYIKQMCLSPFKNSRGLAESESWRYLQLRSCMKSTAVIVSNKENVLSSFLKLSQEAQSASVFYKYILWITGGKD